MGFIGGGGNIAIATALPPSFVYRIVNIKYSLWIFSILFFMLA